MPKTSQAFFNIPGAFNIENPVPIHDALAVELDSDLLSALELPNISEGIIVYSEESKKHYTWNGQDRTSATNWIEITTGLIQETPPVSGTFNINLSRNGGVDYTAVTTSIEDIQEGSNTTLGAFAKVKGNWAVKPTLVWATEAENSFFVINEVKYLYFEVWADGILYWFANS